MGILLPLKIKTIPKVLSRLPYRLCPTHYSIWTGCSQLFNSSVRVKVRSTTEKLFEGYFLAITKAVGTLFREQLYSHSLIIIYSTIDTCGLFDVLPTEAYATGATFKAWVKKYLLHYLGIEFKEIDLWAARCSVLHTFTPLQR